MIQAVNGVLHEIGADSRRVLMVFNKIDAVRDKPMLNQLLLQHAERVSISARNGEGLGELTQRVQEIVEERETKVEWTFSAGNGKLLAYLKQHGKILDIAYEDSNVHVKALIEPRYYGQALAMKDE